MSGVILSEYGLIHLNKPVPEGTIKWQINKIGLQLVVNLKFTFDIIYGDEAE